MAAISEFTDQYGRVDVNAWRHDIAGRLIMDMESGGSGLTTRALCMTYFGYVDLEKSIWMGDQMQAVRTMFQDRPTPLILRSHRYQWYVVKPSDMAAARGFIVERAKRFVRSHERLRTYSSIGQTTYALPGSDPLVKSIDAAEPRVRQVDKALNPPTPNN